MKKIILCACVLLITSPLLSFIPKSIKKVAILDFSGSDDSGVYFSLLLRKKMKKQANFIVTEKAILAKMEQSYPYLYEQKFNPKLIKDIGHILRVDAVLIGHVGNYQVVDKVVKNAKRDYVSTEIFFDVGYRFYETANATLLAEKDFTYNKVQPDPNYFFKDDKKKKILLGRLMGKAVRDLLKDIEEHRIEFKVGKGKRIQGLSDNSKDWVDNPMLFRTFKVYEGLFGPEKETQTFSVGDTLWVNTVLDNLKQTDVGEIWLQIHLLIHDEEGGIVVKEDLILDRHVFDVMEKSARRMPVTLKVVLPSYIKPGTHVLKVLCLDRIHYDFIQARKKITIK